MNKFPPRYTIWQEIDEIKRRLDDLEKDGLILEAFMKQLKALRKATL